MSWPIALAAAARVQISGLHELASFGSRYYLLPISVLTPLLPTAAAVLWIVHLGVGLGRFVVKKPALDLPRFLFFFTLEQLSYQLGVWVQCMKSSFFRPIFPSPIWPGGRGGLELFKKRKDRKPRGAGGRHFVGATRRTHSCVTSVAVSPCAGPELFPKEN